MSALPWRILAQLEIVTLERQLNAEFQIAGEAPAWLQAVDASFSSHGWRRADLHPALAGFMEQAEGIWIRDHAGRRRSIAWKESVANGELYLQATALLVGSRELLLIERVSKERAESMADPALAASDNALTLVLEQQAQSDKLALQQLAWSDPLTSLYNRSGFEELANERLLHSRKALQSHWLLVIDMDNFSAINSTLGHHVGDVSLQSMAGILRAVFRQTDVIGRLESEEFAVLASCVQQSHRDVLVNRLSTELLAFNAQEDITFPLAASVGVAWCDAKSSAGLTELMTQAGARTHSEKRGKTGGNRRSSDAGRSIA